MGDNRILIGNASLRKPNTRAVCAAARVFVTLNEEKTFHVSDQSLHSGRFGHPKAALGSTVPFTGYQVGAVSVFLFAYSLPTLAELGDEYGHHSRAESLTGRLIGETG